MPSSTLITFLLLTPGTVKSVQLLGSWDNFSKPYPMERDKRLGSGHWRGCHSFTDIICDGTTAQSTDCKRNGALLEGGQYWYYYRLDDDIEIHDITEPSTTDCPFLPGQEVNVLEVPIQIKEPRGSVSSSSSTAFTLNPDDKFRMLRPPIPDHFRRKSTSQDRPSTRNGSRPLSPVADPDDALRLDSNISQPARVTALDAASICSEPPIPVLGWRLDDPSDRPHTTGALTSGDYLGGSFRLNSHLSGLLPTQFLPATRLSSSPVKPASQANDLEESVRLPEDTTAIACSMAALDLDPSSTMDCSNLYSESDTSTSPDLRKPVIMDRSPLPSRVSSIRAVQAKAQSVEQASAEGAKTFRSEDEPQLLGDGCAPSLQHTASTSSARTSGMWSSLTSGSYANDLKRHSRLSQPLTPTMSAIGDLIFETAFDEQPLETTDSPVRRLDGGFLGYSLPEAESSSVLTIRNLETANSWTSGHGSDPYNESQRKQYVEAWNDGNKDRTTALQELVDDLGYLGSMIV